MKQTNNKTPIKQRIIWKPSIFLLLFFTFLSYSGYSQTASGVSLNWNSYVGCQLFGEIRENGGKDPVLIDDIIDGQCITVCRESTVTYTLSGNLAANPNTTWTVTGGSIISQSNTTCMITWHGLGSSSLTLTTTSLTGVVTKTICFEKVEIPNALFTIAPFTDPEKEIYGCSLQTIFFNNLSTTNGGSGLYTYFWAFGDDNYSTAFAPTHIYQNDGSYEIKLTVTNSCGCSSTFSKKIKIGEKGFDITCPSVVCEGQTTSYSLPFDGQELCHNHYNWTVVGGAFTDQNDGSVDVTWNHVDASGFGTVTFNPSECNLSCLIPTTIRIPVIQTRGTILGNSSTCLNSQERYVLPQWPATIFTWSVVGNTGESLAHIIHTDQRNEVIIQPRVPGDIVLRCSYQNTLLHCGGTAEFTIHVVNVMQINGPATLCQNTTGNYNIPTGENSSWTLKNSFGTTVASSANSNTFAYNFTTAGTYTLSISGSPSCPSNTLTITVVPSPPAAPSISGALLECPNSPYTYTIPGSNPSGVYNWSVTGGTFIGSNTGNTVVVQFNTNASHVLSVVNQTQNPIQCNSSVTSITVTKQPINASISAANSDICANTNATYQAIKLGITPETLYTDGDTYAWSIWNSTNTTAMPSLGSVTTGQGTNSINILWNNVTTLTTVTLRLTIQKCTVTQTFTKVITIKPVAQIAVTASTNPICSGSSITFTVVSTNGVTLDPLTSVNWNFGNGVTPTGGLSITTSYTNTSLANIGRNVTATIVDPNGCIGNAVSPIYVVTVLPAPNAAVSITSGGNAFCPPTPITSVLTATYTTGATPQWFKVGSATVLGSGPTLAVNDTTPMGYGSYYFIATNAAGCSTRSNNVDIVPFCSSGTCTISPPQTVTNYSDLGCFSPTTPSNCNCGIINLIGTASGSPTSDYWNIVGPNAANSWSNYTGSSIGTISTPLEPGDYQIFHIASYTCTNGSPANLTQHIKVTVPYVANFSYSVVCNGSNYNIALVDTSPYYAPVTNRTFSYYTGSTATGPWTLVGSTADYTLTNQGSGNRYIRLVITGDLYGVAQTPCEKIKLVSIAANTVQTISASAAYCHDTAIKFILTGSANPGDTYFWTFDGGAQNTLDAPSRVFNSSGPQTVTLQITNRYGCPKPLLTYNLTVPARCFNGSVTPASASVCAGNSVTLQYAPSGTECAVNTYTWMNGNIPTGITSSSMTVNTEGFYWVKVKSAAPNSCSYETPNRVTPVFKPLPTLETTPLATYCRLTDIPISITTNAPTISWVIDGAPYGNFDNQSSIILPGNWGFVPGTHTVLVTVTSVLGCSKNATLSFTIANTPPPPVITTALLSCNPYTIQLEATGSFGYFNWSNGSSGSNTIIVNNGGPFEVTASAGGCISRSQIDVPKSPEDYLWVFPSGCFTGCSNSIGTLIGPSILPVKAWEWDYEHHPYDSGIDSVPPTDLSQSGVYNLTLNTGLCEQTSHDLNYTLVDCKDCPMEVHIEKLESQDSPFCTAAMDIIVYNASGNPLPITVMSPNNEVIVSANSFTALPGGPNIFHVTVTPINGFNGGPLVLFIRGFDTKKNELCSTPLQFDMPECHPSGKMQDQNTISKNDLVIAPNPSKGVTSISYSHSSAPTLEVYSLLGRKVASYTAPTTKGRWELTTTGLPTGVYIVVMKENDVVLLQQKLLIE
jgi:hypothetical protein